jgi:hypothetical protein
MVLIHLLSNHFLQRSMSHHRGSALRTHPMGAWCRRAHRPVRLTTTERAQPSCDTHLAPRKQHSIVRAEISGRSSKSFAGFPTTEVEQPGRQT